MKWFKYILLSTMTLGLYFLMLGNIANDTTIRSNNIIENQYSSHDSKCIKSDVESDDLEKADVFCDGESFEKKIIDIDPFSDFCHFIFQQHYTLKCKFSKLLLRPNSFEKKGIHILYSLPIP